MTKQEATVIEMYTGVCMLTGDDRKYFYEYAEKLLGRPIMTHEYLKYAEKLKELSKPDFLKVCKSAKNNGWIPVEERMPEKNEYFVDTSSNKDFPNGYYRRLEIAYMTDTIEYVHGYYDGYKWMDKYLNAIKNVVAWRIHGPYQPKTITQRPEWKDRMLHTFLGGHHD